MHLRTSYNALLISVNEALASEPFSTCCKTKLFFFNTTLQAGENIRTCLYCGKACDWREFDGIWRTGIGKESNGFAAAQPP